MQRFIGVMAFSALLAAPAMAADIPVKAAPPAVAVPTWSGCYIGGNGGYGWGNTRQYFINGIQYSDHDSKGAVAGGQVGCDIQNDRWVYGVEFRYDWSDIHANATLTNFIPATTSFSTKLQSFGLLTFRTGFAVTPNLLVFYRGGAAFGRVYHQGDTNTLAVGGAVLNAENMRYNTGWLTAGGGLEYMVFR